MFTLMGAMVREVGGVFKVCSSIVNLWGLAENDG